LTPADLRGENSLVEFLPLLGSHPDTEIRKAAGMARIGHNHWVMQRLEREIRRHSTSTDRLRAWVASVVEQYVDSSANEAWRQAVRVAWEVADAAAKTLANVSPGEGVDANSGLDLGPAVG